MFCYIYAVSFLNGYNDASINDFLAFRRRIGVGFPPNVPLTGEFLKRLEGPMSNFIMCVIVGTDRRIVKDLEDRENNNEKSMQPQ